jgi:hypothetical protein
VWDTELSLSSQDPISGIGCFLGGWNRAGGISTTIPMLVLSHDHSGAHSDFLRSQDEKVCGQ